MKRKKGGRADDAGAAGGALRVPRALRAVWRLARLAAQVAGGLAIVALRFPRLDTAGRRREVQRWSRRVLRALDVGLAVEGRPAAGGVLLVANHVSWLDIVAIDAVVPARFVAKAELRRWPLVGRLVSAGDTLYLSRERSRDAHRVVHAMAAALGADDILAVFPEGTTGDGRVLLPFHANLLQAAIPGQVPVQPVALRFADARRAFSPAVEFVGATTFVQSVWRVARADALRVHVTLLVPETAAGRTRRELAQALRSRLAAVLDEAEARASAAAVTGFSDCGTDGSATGRDGALRPVPAPGRGSPTVA